MKTENPGTNADELANEGPKFLDRDFNQCFQQMRHYDAQSVDICKFAFTAYSAVVALAFALHQYGIAQKGDFTLPAAVTLCVGLAFGFCFLGMLIRNRVYFVVVTRYVNEHRRFFLQCRPLGFLNHSKMYTSLDNPPYFNWRSSEAFLMYLMCALNAFLAGAAAHFLFFAAAPRWKATILTVAAVFVIQVLWCGLYLRAREDKAASKAVFNKD